MEFSGAFFRHALAPAVVFTFLASAGCGNGCFVAFSNNGNGGVIIRAGNPPPCSVMQTSQGAVRVVALKSPVCESCTNAARAEHILLTLRSIQIRLADGSGPEEWRELAPQFADPPRQIDFIDATPLVLLENATVPAGSYGELRLQFVSDVSRDTDPRAGQNLCRKTGRSCIVRADGQVEPVRQLELTMPLETPDGSPLFLFPDGRLELRITVAAIPAGLDLSSPDAATPATVLFGQVTATREHRGAS
jgi:hypothetical protein